MEQQRDRQIRNYISQLVELEDADDPLLSPDELREIVLELGYDESDLQRLERTAEAHRTRGKNYKKIGELDSAVNEYAMALAMEPQDIAAQIRYAEVLFARYRDTGDPEDEQLARKLARQCVTKDPDFAPAYRLLKRITDYSKPSTRSTLLEKAKKPLLFVVSLLALVGFGVAQNILAPKPSEQSAAKTARLSKLGSGGAEKSPKLPVEVSLPDGLDLQVDVTRSEVIEMLGKAGYSGDILVTNTGEDQAIKGLRATLTVYDDQERQLAVFKYPSHLTAGPPVPTLYPGESYSDFYSNAMEDPDMHPARARFEVTEFETIPADGPQEVVELQRTAASDLARHVTLVSRGSNRSSSGFERSKAAASRRASADFALKLSDRAPRSIGKVKLRVEYYDKNGDLLDSDSFDPYRDRLNALSPGTASPFAKSLRVPEGTQSHQVVLVEAKG